MNYFYIEPYVAGGIGENTVLEKPGPRPIISRLNYEVEDWEGDVLLRGFPCFIVTLEAMQTLQTLSFTGNTFDDVEVTTSHEFDQLNPDTTLPTFMWLKVSGVPGQDDFGIAPDSRLVTSERALIVFRQLGVPNAVVTPYEVTQT